jgi:hypothetical protein
MKPKWFSSDQLPYEQMWPDDKHWLPLVLAGKRVQGEFQFDENYNLVTYKVGEHALSPEK